jgi:hypothetical protein
LEESVKFPDESVAMRFKTIFISAVLLVIGQNPVFADPPIPLEPSDRLIIEACILTSEKPHISGHVPGTVNVTGRTVCKGISTGRALQVSVTLTRSDGGNTLPVTRGSRGTGTVVVNVSMPCIWVSKQSEIEYIVTTVHKLSNGKKATTKNKAKLKC